METEIADFYTEPYDCNIHEARPENVVYTAGFRELQNLNKAAASILRKPLEESKFQNSMTKGLTKEINKRTKEDFPDQVKFAIVGDTKAGKSSVINSILSMGTIARKVRSSLGTIKAKGNLLTQSRETEVTAAPGLSNGIRKRSRTKAPPMQQKCSSSTEKESVTPSETCWPGTTELRTRMSKMRKIATVTAMTIVTTQELSRMATCGIL